MKILAVRRISNFKTDLEHYRYSVNFDTKEIKRLDNIYDSKIHKFRIIKEDNNRILLYFFLNAYEIYIINLIKKDDFYVPTLLCVFRQRTAFDLKVQHYGFKSIWSLIYMARPRSVKGSIQNGLMKEIISWALKRFSMFCSDDSHTKDGDRIWFNLMKNNKELFFYNIKHNKYPSESELIPITSDGTNILSLDLKPFKLKDFDLYLVSKKKIV